MGDPSFLLLLAVTPLLFLGGIAGLRFATRQLRARRRWWAAIVGSMALIISLFAGLVTYAVLAPCDAPGIECLPNK